MKEKIPVITDRQFYKTFLALSLPIILQNVISLSVNLADNMMLGNYGEASLSGVTAVNQIQFVYQMLLTGAGDGLVILAAQYWGKKDMQSIRKVAGIAMRTGLIIMGILFVVVSVMPSRVISLFTNDPAIAAEAMKYLAIIRFTYPFFCITQILLALLRSVEKVQIAFWLSLSTLIINCCINWVLIYGHFGFPSLGVQGAAIGTLTARIVEVVILLLYLRKTRNLIGLQPADFLHVDKILRSDYIRVTVPVLLVQGLWGANTAMQTAILGHMSSSAIAANSMASNLFMIVKTIAIGSAATASIMIGKTIGEGQMQKIKSYAKTLQVMFVIVGVVSSLVLFGLTEPVLSLYSFSDESRQLARSFLHVMCIAIIGMSYQMPTNSGIIKGGGDTKYILKMDIISIWCIVIPLSIIMAFVVGAPPVIVVWCLNLDQLFKCIPAYIKCNHRNWVIKLTR